MSPESAATGRQPGFRHFHDQLDELKQRLLTMSERAESLVDLAVESLLTRDADKAAAVVTGDLEVDDLEIEIEGMAIELLALQQPMARDLRFIISAIKASSDLERVGDHAVNIAQCAKRLSEALPISAVPELDRMADGATSMLRDAIEAFIARDAALAADVCRRDDEVDGFNDSIFRIMLTVMAENPKTISSALQILLVSRNLERIADLATNVAEDVIYVVEARTIKHHVNEPPREGEHDQ